jgi:pimeloyl-ACP methyl ester carboxylesterase
MMGYFFGFEHGETQRGFQVSENDCKHTRGLCNILSVDPHLLLSLTVAFMFSVPTYSVLFVHGGPGGAVVDYNNGNKRFFDERKMFVVEVDQRGTGYSEPSVRDDWHNMKLYANVSIEIISKDYERVRNYLGIDQWLVWGGSYGSTIGIDYSMRYPQSVLSLILRCVKL